MNSSLMLQAITYTIIFLGTINILRMSIFLIGSDIYNIQEHIRRRRNKSASYPFSTFTVIVPAHNEEKTIISCVKSIVQCKYPHDKVQIIIVDDGSTDKTASIVEKYRKQNPVRNIQILKQTNQGKAHALNNGLRSSATGELVMCLDADSSLDPDALRETAKYFADEQVVALAANVKIRPMKTILNLTQRIEYLISYQFKRSLTFFNIEYIVGGIGSVFRHSTLEQVGYYDTDTVTEDIDLTMKLLKLGNKKHRVIYGPDVIAYTEGVLDISGLIRQRFRWKYGRAQTLFKNIKMFFSTSEDQNKLLTCLYLPFIVFSDLVFFLEPILFGYLVFVSIYYHNINTFIIAFSVMTTFITLNILAEDTIPFYQRLKIGLFAPFMYFLFYIINYVEYVALIKSAYNMGNIWRSAREGKQAICSWEPVDRADRKA